MSDWRRTKGQRTVAGRVGKANTLNEHPVFSLGSYLCPDPEQVTKCTVPSVQHGTTERLVDCHRSTLVIVTRGMGRKGHHTVNSWDQP